MLRYLITVAAFIAAIYADPEIPTVDNDGCDQLMNICFEKCGSPLFFSRSASHCQTSSYTNKVTFCMMPPGCDCDVPEILGDINVCDQATCKDWDYIVPGGISWCNNCAYDCGGYQQDCIDYGGFCESNARCGALSMCSISTNSPTLSPTNSPTLSPTNSPTNSPTLSPTLSPTNSMQSPPGEIFIFIMVGITIICLIIGFVIFIMRKQIRQPRKRRYERKHGSMVYGVRMNNI